MAYTSEAAEAALSTYGNAPTVGPGDKARRAKKKAKKKRDKRAKKGMKNHSKKPTGCSTGIMTGGRGRR